MGWLYPWCTAAQKWRHAVFVSIMRGNVQPHVSISSRFTFKLTLKLSPPSLNQLNNSVTQNYIRTLFYGATVTSHFPSARLTYKSSTYNEQFSLLRRGVCEPQETISSTFCKCGEWKPNINCNTLNSNLWTPAHAGWKCGERCAAAVTRNDLSDECMRASR